jgi:thiol:disulfide interchange protein
VTPGFFWLAASTGLLSLLTPCVFPMVPITIAYFSTPDRHNPRGLRRALLFALGIIGTFTILGLVLAAVFGAAGLNRFAADPWVNLGLAAIFLVFAANLFGWFQIGVPWRVASAADRAARDATPGSSLGALVMGATFTLTSVTCTAPFVGTLLVLASQGSWTTPIAGMLVYSAAFALPFFVLAATPGLVAHLPRSGEWIRTLRVLIGLLEVAAAIKFLSNADLVRGWGIFTRDVVLIGWAALALGGAVYLGRNLGRRTAPRGMRASEIVPVAVALLIAAWLASGLRGRQLPQVEAFLPPTVSTAPASQTGELVFVDFTGYTCTNCRWMEANIFTRPDVSAELGRFVLSRLYTDGEGEIYEQQQAFQEKTFGTVALPLYAVVDSDGKVRATFSGLTRNPADFIAFLRRARS